MMLIKINNEETEVTEGTTLSMLAADRHLPDKGVAIAVNNELAPRTSWDDYLVKGGDNIIIVKAFSGG